MEPNRSRSSSSGSDNDEFFDWVTNENENRPFSDNPFFVSSPNERIEKKKEAKIISFGKYDSLPNELKSKMSSNDARYSTPVFIELMNLNYAFTNIKTKLVIKETV